VLGYEAADVVVAVLGQVVQVPSADDVAAALGQLVQV
jgi:hypothetical protein